MDYNTERTLLSILNGMTELLNNVNVSESQRFIGPRESEDIGKTLQSVQQLLDEATLTVQPKSQSCPVEQRSSLLNLPIELFLLIVKNVLSESDGYDVGSYYGQLTGLCLVCKDWADNIHSHPELWTHVDLSVSQELLRTVLPRSGGLPLDIKGSVGSFSVAGRIRLEAHRWRSLTVSSNDGRIMDSFLAKPAPCLQKLTLLGPWKWVASANVFEGTAPKLEEVVLQSCAVSWKSPILSDLTKLTLHRISENSPQLDDLLDILAASPRLRDLKIGFTTIHISPSSSRRVTLPNLRSLSLGYISRESMMRILSSIDAPLSVDCDFFIRVEEDMPLEGQLEAVSQQLAVHAQNARNTPSTLTLQMGYWMEDEDDWDAIFKYEVEGEGLGALDIAVMTHPGIHVDVLDHLAGRIQPYTKSSPLKLRLVKVHRVLPYDESRHLLCRLDRTFPNVQEIALVDLDFGAIVDALYRLFPEPTSGTSPLFPQLTTLTVRQDSHGDWALWLRDYRRRFQGGGIDPLPRNLTLRLEGGWIGAESLQALQQLVPGTLSLDNVQVKEKVPEANRGSRLQYPTLIITI